MRNTLTVSPAVSSVAAAFAAVALPWDDALVVSAHGKPLDAAIAAARWHRKVAVLTSADGGVRELAVALPARTFVLAERLGEPDERVIGMLSFVPWGRSGVSLDVMRRDRNGPNGVVETMVSEMVRGADTQVVIW